MAAFIGRFSYPARSIQAKSMRHSRTASCPSALRRILKPNRSESRYDML